jgi:CRP-like cAMP-binding protein
MVEKLPSLPSELSERPRYAAQVTEDLLTGGRRLRQAFLQTPMRFAGRDMPLIRPSDPEPSVILMRSGFAFRFCGLADGRRAILNVVTPGDFIGQSRRSPRRTASAITSCAPRRSAP